MQKIRLARRKVVRSIFPVDPINHRGLAVSLRLADTMTDERIVCGVPTHDRFRTFGLNDLRVWVVSLYLVQGWKILAGTPCDEGISQRATHCL